MENLFYKYDKNYNIVPTQEELEHMLTSTNNAYILTDPISGNFEKMYIKKSKKDENDVIFYNNELMEYYSCEQETNSIYFIFKYYKNNIDFK